MVTTMNFNSFDPLFKQKLHQITDILRSTRTDEKYIPKADKWRGENESFGIYKNSIDCHEVYPNIILGNWASAKCKEFLKDIGVTHVLNCAMDNINYDGSFGETYYKDYGIKFKGFRLMDMPSENISRYFDEAIEFIDEAINNNKGGKVLVHCLAGVSRSATITIAYLMKRHNMKLEDACTLVKRNRDIFPNEGFLKQLVHLDMQLRKDSDAK